MSLFEHPVLLLVLPLLLRFLPWRALETKGWEWRIDGAIWLGVTLLSGGLQVLWLVDFQLAPEAWPTSDFGDYCLAVAAVALDQPEQFPGHRPMGPAFLPAWLAGHLGVVGGLGWTARLCAFGTTAGLFLWGRGLHGRLAGVAAALLAGAVYPLLFITKTLSFYPQSTAVFTLTMGCLAMAARDRHWAWFLATGVGIGLGQLVGLRSLFWSLPALGLGLALVIWPPWKQLPLRLALLLLPLVASYGAGRALYSETETSLEAQLDVPRILNELGFDVPQRSTATGGSRYVWGWTSPLDIPKTLRTIWNERALVPPPDELEHITGQARRQHVEPWLAPMAVALLAAAWALRRRPDLFLVLLGSCLPFWLAWQGSVRFTWGHMRFIGQASPFIPLVLGVGFASLAGQEPEGFWWKVERPPWGREAWAWTLAPVTLLLAWVLGILPSFLGPAADWKPAQVTRPDGSGTLICELRKARGLSTQRCMPAPTRRLCAQALRQDAQAQRDALAERLALQDP